MNLVRPIVTVLVCSAAIAQAAERAWHFPTDILPLFTKAGCNAGKCHGASTGQGGFKLSLLGDNPAADHAAITRENSARRIDFTKPERSLILRKSARELDHEGGQKLRANSQAWNTVRDWIAAGTPLGDRGLRVSEIQVTPAEVLLSGAGQTAQLRITARFSDGQERDVTAMSVFTSRDESVVTVNKSGRVRVHRPGLAAIMIRAMGQVATTRVLVPYAAAKAGGYPKPRNFIDEKVFAELQRLRIPVSVGASDHVFLRRVYLSLSGRLPTADDARAFLKKPDRDQLIDRLIGSEAFVDYWTLKFADLLLIDSKKLGLEPARAYRGWLRAQIARNTPMEQIARALLTAQGNFTANAPANFHRQKPDPRDMGEFVSQTLLGVRMACARCHNHPVDRWTQADYYRFAAHFARTRVREGEVVVAQSGEVRNPRSEQVVMPSPLGEATNSRAAGLDYRPALADWLTHPDNPFFARALLNRVWRGLMRRGLVEPVDDLRVTNPPSNPVLLDALAASFVRNKFNLRRLIRDIARSRTYQFSSRPNGINRDDNRLFSRAYLEKLPAPVLADAICQATGQPDIYVGQPRGTRAVQLLDAHVPSYTLDVFGRCPRTDSCVDSTQFGGGLSQTLHLLNSRALNAKLRPAINRLLKMHPAPKVALEELYLRTLSRYPTDEEAAHWKESIGVAKDAQVAWQDLLWALLNSREFGFNH